MREFIRHPSDIPIKYRIQDSNTIGINNLKNISVGGLCFKSSVPLANGLQLILSIPVIKPAFKAKGVVAWCKKVDDGFDVGVNFFDSDTQYRIRIIEQICQIEHYRKEVQRKEGRTISAETAAEEWIEKYASDFPRSE
ncbi:MAG TPA: PilZ domain-containing protein [Desulfomonilia bacterium]